MSYQVLRGPSEPRGAQTYSVYNYHTKQFDYFEAPLGEVPATGRFRRPSGKISPEQLAAALPANVQHVGSGEAPIGIISVASANVGEVVSMKNKTVWYAAVAVGFAAIAATSAQKKKQSYAKKRKSAKKGGFFSFLWGKK
jgi:hypothetical protein